MKNHIEKYFLKEVFKHFEKTTTKVVLYGSFNLKNMGDFDVAVICKDYNENQKKHIKDILQNLHRKFGLRIDEDVPYFNKSLFNYEECDYVLKHPPFSFEKNKVVIYPFYGNSEYFGSVEARYRLLINLLSTRVKLLHGNISTERSRVYQLLIGIIFSTNNNRSLSIDKIAQYLCIDPFTYYSYKRYLGYNPFTDFQFLKKNIKTNIYKMVRDKKIIKNKKEFYLSESYLNLINSLNYEKYESINEN